MIITSERPAGIKQDPPFERFLYEERNYDPRYFREVVHNEFLRAAFSKDPTQEIEKLYQTIARYSPHLRPDEVQMAYDAAGTGVRIGVIGLARPSVPAEYFYSKPKRAHLQGADRFVFPVYSTADEAFLVEDHGARIITMNEKEMKKRNYYVNSELPPPFILEPDTMNEWQIYTSYPMSEQQTMVGDY